MTLDRVLARPWRASLTAVLAGVLGAFAMPPVDLAGLGVVGAAAALWLLGGAETRRAGIAIAAGYAVGHFGVLFAWSLRFGLAPYLALVVTQAAFLLPVGAVAVRRRARSAGSWIVLVTATWALMEGLRARIPLGGFEWGQLGITAHGLPVRSAAAVVGTLGTTALLVALAAALVSVLHPPRPARRWHAPTVVAGVVVGATLLGTAPWTQPSRTLTVATVQVDPVCPGRYSVDCPQQTPELLARHVASTQQLPAGVDLVLWGEGALGGRSPEEAGATIAERGGGLPAPLLAGVTTPLGAARFANRNVLFDTGGQVVASYAKRQPVPFGEYVPGRQLLGRIGDVGRLVPSDMVAGQVPGRLELGDVTLGTVSSWEVTFSRLVRDTGRLGEAVVTLTTQSTYERAAVSDQLLRIAQLRAAELQRPVLVAATTGRSSVIDASGRRGTETRLYGADVLVEDVELTVGSTPFARWGDGPVLVAAVLALAVAGGRARVLRSARRPRP